MNEGQDLAPVLEFDAQGGGGFISVAGRMLFKLH